MISYSEFKSYPIALAVSVAATLAGFAIDQLMHPVNIALVYLLAILLVALRTSLRPALVCAVACFLLFNFFFTEPRLTLLMTQRDDILTMILFLAVASLAGLQAVRLRNQVLALEEWTRIQRLQFQLSQDLLSATSLDEAFQPLKEALADLRVRDIELIQADPSAPDKLMEKFGFSLESQVSQLINWGQGNVPEGDSRVLIALNDGQTVVGVLRMNADDVRMVGSDLIETLAQQTCLALNRIRLAQDVQRERLYKEREMLRSALLSSVSHDLRTPLASLIGSASSLIEFRDSLSEGQQLELLGAILEEAQRLDNYTRNLLDMVRLEHGEMELRRDWIGLDEILSIVIKRIKPTLVNRKLLTNIPGDLPLFYVHGALIEQSIFNVLDNAIKFSPDGSEISIGVKTLENCVQVDISDQGIGIPEADRENVFDLFHRGDRADKHSAGTGLGLTIATGMMRAHNGDISLLKTSGQGSTFRLTLPINEPPDEAV